MDTENIRICAYVIILLGALGFLGLIMYLLFIVKDILGNSEQGSDGM